MRREQRPFQRPLTSAPTRHLLLANCDSSSEQQRAAIAQLFSSYRPITITTDHDPRRCFVTLPTETAAAAAKAELDGRAALGGRGPLVVKFSERRDDKFRQDAAAAQAQEPPLVAVRRAAECGIPGLTLHLDFVSHAEEAALLHLADSQQHWNLLAKRRVLHFGHVFDYESRGLGPPQHPLPPAARAVAARIEALPGATAIDQLTVNEYAAGVGISPHVETHSAFTGVIVSLSLAGPAVMVLRQGREQRALLLPPRSLLIMAGEARYCWQHYIPHRKTDLVAGTEGGGAPEAVPRAPRRVSFTFRQVRGFPCTCPHPQFCDSQLAPLEPTRLALQRMALQQQQQQQKLQQAVAASSGNKGSSSDDSGGTESGIALQVSAQPHAGAAGAADDGGDTEDRQLAALERQYVHHIYEAIAPHFAATRFAVWPGVRAFLEVLPPWALLADVGCGNGKYWGVRRDVFVLGSDRSEGLTNMAARRLRSVPAGEGLRADVAVADGLSLPYRPASFDGVLCIAVLHHISSPARRLALLDQLLHMLRPGGRALVTVWATQQENMVKVRSWQPVRLAASTGAAEGSWEEKESAPPAAAAITAREACAEAPRHSTRAQRGRQQPAARERSAAVASGDYFVPWHLPFHRAGAAAAAQEASTDTQQQQQQQQEEAIGAASNAAAGAGRAGGVAALAGAPRLDTQKGAVVYQRYYHLFAMGELDALVLRLPGATLVDSFYDKDNWCCVFERL